jgi:hypothetical protein
VRNARGGSDPATDRFVVIDETPAADSSFAFRVASLEMALSEVCEALMARHLRAGRDGAAQPSGRQLRSPLITAQCFRCGALPTGLTFPGS